VITFSTGDAPLAGDEVVDLLGVLVAVDLVA
jgi:hypothetical protein